jgi:hypothetical protein
LIIAAVHQSAKQSRKLASDCKFALTKVNTNIDGAAEQVRAFDREPPLACSRRCVLRDVGERGAQKFQPGADFAAFNEQHASES